MIGFNFDIYPKNLSRDRGHLKSYLLNKCLSRSKVTISWITVTWGQMRSPAYVREQDRERDHKHTIKIPVMSDNIFSCFLVTFLPISLIFRHFSQLSTIFGPFSTQIRSFWAIFVVFSLVNIYEQIFSCIFVFFRVWSIVRFSVFDILESVQSWKNDFRKNTRLTP